MTFLRSQQTFQGISVKQLKDGWNGCLVAIDELEKNGAILVLRTKRKIYPVTFGPILVTGWAVLMKNLLHFGIKSKFRILQTCPKSLKRRHLSQRVLILLPSSLIKDRVMKRNNASLVEEKLPIHTWVVFSKTMVHDLRISWLFWELSYLSI